MPTGGSAINNTGLYVWYRASAAGSGSIETTHNASKYAVVFDFYEFVAGTTFSGAAAVTGVSPNGGAGPTMSGLTGTNWTAGAVGVAFNTRGTWTASWGSGTELVATATPQSRTDGYVYSLTAIDGDTATSRAYAATTPSPAGASPTVERLVFAVKVPAAVAPTDQPFLRRASIPRAANF